MSPEAGVGIRLVKCPRCGKILLESPEVSMYRCGCCGIVLQAKIRKPEAQKSDSAAECDQDNVLAQTDDRSSSDSPPKCDQLSHNRGASDGVSGSPDITSKSSPSQVQDPLTPTKSDVGSKELRSSGEISLNGETYISEASEHVDQLHSSRDFSAEEKNDAQLVWPEVDEVQNLPEYEEQESVFPENDETSPISSINQIGDSSDEIKPVVADENGIIAPPVELVGDGSRGRSSVAERSRPLNPSNSIGAHWSPSKGSLVSFYLTSDDEQLDHSPNKFQRFNSVYTMGSSNLGYYPTSRNYYAYDGSESSYDGIDDGVLHPSPKDKGIEEDLGRRYGLSVNERSYWGTNPSNHAMHRSKSTEANTRNRMRRDDVSRSPSRGHRNNLPPLHPAFKLSDKSSYSDPDKIDLLRTVYQLTDQLQRMQFPNDMPNRRFSHNLLPSERDMHADVSHTSQYNRRHDRAKRYSDPRMAFSGEVSHCRHRASSSCMHCYSQDWHYSAQLPCCYGNGHQYASSESSPQGRLAEIEWLHLREKYQTVKKHLRPIAGGAPFVACYHCSQLLQLPVDFLLFKKRYHKLMCNACRRVLKFAGTTHLIPDPFTTPPSEAGDYKKKVPHSSSCQALSCSDRSFCRSCSTEAEDASVVLPPHDQDSYCRKMSSASSHDRKLKGILKEGSVRPSRATTSVSEIEELPPSPNPPLHRLMGYSTPSKVFRR